MRKNMIFGVIGFALALVAGGHAFAAGTTPTNISMGMFSIPLPSNGVDGKDGCAPLIRSTAKDANDCYEIQQNLQTWDDNNKVCTSVVDGVGNQVWTKITEVCDGADGTDGAVNVTKVYVPYPESAETNAGQEGYIKVTIPGGDGEADTILMERDYCEKFFDETDDGILKKKCTAQGDATNWYNSDGTSIYQQGDSYIFAITDLEDGYPRYEYTAPRSSGGAVISRGFTQKVYAYDDGRLVTETGATDECKEYARPDNRSARVTKCTVQSYQYPANLLSTWVPNTTYCLGNHQSDCSQYTIPVGAVDACAGLTSSDDAWETRVVHSESEYVEHVYNTGCTTNCTGTVGYKLIKEEMCNGDVNESTNLDPCEYATLPVGVTCGSGYAYQSCTPQVTASGSTASAYYGCFPDNWSDFAHRNDIVPANFASDGTNLYWCQIQDCENTSACWIGSNKANGPNPSGQSDGTNCWGVVSIDGLQGDAGPGCSFAYYNDKWQVCCLPVDSSGNINVNGQWDCKEVTDSSILNQLNNWMCKPTYTTKYINKKSDGTYEYKPTDTNNRTAATVGIRTTITNCDGTNGGDVDVFDGPAGDDYDPCDGLTSGSTAALTTVHNTTNVYVPHGNGSNGTTTGIGYYTETNVMCDTEGNKIVKKYDKCDPVSLASGVSRTVGGKTCLGNQTLLMCTPQEAPTTPYYVCSDAEVSTYPKLVYVAPTVSDGKFTARGYTKRVHKYTSDGAEVDGTERHNPDECHTVYKRTFGMATDDGTGVRTATTTTQSTLKCTVQTPGTTGWGVGTEYCLNTTDNASTSCDGYAESTSDVITSTLRYHLPIMGTGSDYNKPKEPGYTYDAEVPSGQSETLRITNRKPDKCETLLTRTNSGTGTVSSSVTKCTVGAPTGTPGLESPYTAGAPYCLGYVNGTCPGGLIDIGSAIDDAADNDPCAALPSNASDNDKKALIKKTTRLYTEPAGGGTVKTAAGFTTFTRETCLPGTFVTDKDEDICNPIMPADPTVCTDGVYYACSNPNYNNGSPYYYCDTSTNNLHNACANVSNADEPNTVKSVVSRVYTRAANSQGSMVSTYKMCDDTDHTESTADECKEVPTPSGENCTNGVWMQCTRQADEGTEIATARGTTYGYCATYPQCVGNSSSALIVKKTQRSYTAPTKTNNGDAYYTTPGKVTDVKIACNGSTISTEESSEDECQEVPLNTFACPDGKPVRKQCKRQGKEDTNNAGTIYNICTTGTSIFGAISDNDPCGGDTTSEAARKKVKSIQYEYVAGNATGNTARVGYTKKTTVMCNSSESDKEEYIYDTCVSVAAAYGCNGASDKNYKCYNQTQPATASASAREYNTCNPSESAVALSSAVANKLDSDVTFSTATNSNDGNKQYIFMSSASSGVLTPVVAVDTLKPQSLFEIWKEQYVDMTDDQCKLLFGTEKDCSASGNNLTTSDMLGSFTAYGVWKEETVKNSQSGELTAEDLSMEAYRDSLKPCKSFGIEENVEYSGGNGKEYIMTCIE